MEKLKNTSEDGQCIAKDNVRIINGFRVTVSYCIAPSHEITTRVQQLLLESMSGCNATDNQNCSLAEDNH